MSEVKMSAQEFWQKTFLAAVGQDKGFPIDERISKAGAEAADKALDLLEARFPNFNQTRNCVHGRNLSPFARCKCTHEEIQNWKELFT